MKANLTKLGDIISKKQDIHKYKELQDNNSYFTPGQQKINLDYNKLNVPKKQTIYDNLL